MPATIVVGGQYGSEGKGKVVALLAQHCRFPWLVRCGGPNSGHTVTIDGSEIILRQVPSCSEPTTAVFCIAAGCAVDEKLLIRELDMLKIERQRIIVDPRAVLVTDADRQAELSELNAIGSTCSGTGAALIRRMSRRGDVGLVGSSERITRRCRVETVATLLHQALDDDADIIVEGTQGFGLSLLHGPDYPFVTSRDTTAAAFAAEVGLSPRAIDRILLVIRTFPIRVAGTSGPFTNEISWERVQTVSNAPKVFPEYTSVTKRLRRVAGFDINAVKRACMYNGPTGLAVMGIDRLDFANTGIREAGKMTSGARRFLEDIESAVGIPIELVGTGFGTFDALQLAITPSRRELAHA